MNVRKFLVAGLMVAGYVAMGTAQEAPTGAAVQPTSKEQKAINAFKGKVKGKIVWSTSRENSKHDIWIMDADGSNKKALTSSPNNVDWFPRFSPDGSKVLFTRSKSGWVNEMDAEVFDLWDLWMINVDGTDEKKVVEKAAWGTFHGDDNTVVFARGPKTYKKDLTSGKETLIFDAEKQFGKKKVYCQQPSLSPNGRYLAITVRGTIRQTGIMDLEKNEWIGTGGGCQINWYPDGKHVLRMNEGQGNGGTEVLSIPLGDDGKPTVRMKGLSIPKQIRFMDLPGRRSHEYFPKLDQTGTWMVWCATQYGHEHDIVDYEVYIWNINTNPKKDAVRLTFHTANDRWPDIFTEK